MSDSTQQHRAAAGDRKARCAVLTISDTRTPDTDTGGKLIRDLLTEAGHTVTDHAITPDDAPAIDTQLRFWLPPPRKLPPRPQKLSHAPPEVAPTPPDAFPHARDAASKDPEHPPPHDTARPGNDAPPPTTEPLTRLPQLILTTGGTGIAERDTTIEVVTRLLDKQLEGFGELFRMLSYEEVGPAAMLSRAVAGLAGSTLLFTLPGSPNAINLAMTRLILPELPHLIWERGPRNFPPRNPA